MVGCSGICDEGLRYVAENCPSLTSLDVSECHLISDEGVKSVAKGCNNLGTLRLAGLANITKRGTAALAKRAPQLLTLVLAGCASIDDAAVAALSPMRLIVTLDISLCRRVTDKGVARAPNWSLKSLYLAGLPLLTSRGLDAIGKAFADLQLLDLAACEGFDNPALATMGARCTKLHTVNVYGCPAVSSSVLEEIASSRHNLQVAAANSPGEVDPSLARPRPPTEMGIDRWSSGPSFEGMYLDTRVGDMPVPFFGVCRRPGYILAFEQHQVQRAAEEKAALELQCVYRSLKARGRLGMLRQGRQQDEWDAATNLQSFMRQKHARHRVQEIRHQKRFIAQRLGYLWRRRTHKRRVGRAMRHWIHRQMASTFRDWVVRAGEWRLERLNVKAGSIFTNKATAVAWRCWVAKTHEKRHLKGKLHSALGLWRRRTGHAILSAWSEAVLDKQDMREAISHVFMFATPLAWHNTARASSRFRSAVHFYERSLVNRAFSVFQKIAAARREMEDIALKHALATLMGDAVPLAWVNWRKLVAINVRKRQCLVDADDQFVKTAKRRGFFPLLHHSREQQRRRAAAKKAMAYWTRGTLVRAFSGLVRNREQAHTQDKALKHWTNRLLRSTLARWSTILGNDRARQQLAAKALLRVMNALLVSALEAWREVVKERKAFRLRILKRIRERLLSDIITHWVDYMHEAWEWRREAAFREVCASNIQKMWRGKASREETANYVVMREWAVLKIQGRVRCRMAQWKQYRAIRLRNLHWADDEVERNEQMMVLDEESRVYEGEVRSCIMVQRIRRGCLARIRCKVLRSERTRQRGLLEAEKAVQVLARHEEKVEERKMEEMDRHMRVTLIQRMLRGMQGRVRFHVEWSRHFLYFRAQRIQCNYRGRLGRRRAAARSRLRRTEFQVRTQRSDNARLLRFLGKRTREAQQRTMKSMDHLGMHPESYNLNFRDGLREVKKDITGVVKDLKIQWKVFTKGKLSMGKRRAVRNHALMVRDLEQKVRKHDAIRIVQLFHKRRGQTGYILKIDTTGDQYSGFREQASVKMDADGEIEFINLMSDATAFLVSMPTMIRIEPRFITPVPGALVIENREQLLLIAEEGRLKRQQRVASRFLQKYWRGQKGRTTSADVYEVVTADNERMRVKWRRRLKRVGLATQRTGRVLVRLHLTKKRYIPPEFPDPPLTPAWWLRHKKFQELERAKQEEYTTVSDMRHGRVMELRNSGTELRWRQRTPGALKMWNAISGMRRVFTAPVAAKLQHSMPNAAKCVGGTEFRRTPDEKRYWVGLYQFAQLANSPHVTGNGWAVVHGTWNKSAPDGDGIALFLEGKGFGIPSTYAGERGEWPQYYSMETTFVDGMVGEEVYIRYTDKSKFEGLYVDEPGYNVGEKAVIVAELEALHELKRPKKKHNLRILEIEHQLLPVTNELIEMEDERARVKKEAIAFTTTLARGGWERRGGLKGAAAIAAAIVGGKDEGADTSDASDEDSDGTKDSGDDSDDGSKKSSSAGDSDSDASETKSPKSGSKSGSEDGEDEEDEDAFDIDGGETKSGADGKKSKNSVISLRRPSTLLSLSQPGGGSGRRPSRFSISGSAQGPSVGALSRGNHRRTSSALQRRRTSIRTPVLRSLDAFLKVRDNAKHGNEQGSDLGSDFGSEQGSEQDGEEEGDDDEEVLGDGDGSGSEDGSVEGGESKGRDDSDSDASYTGSGSDSDSEEERQRQRRRQRKRRREEEEEESSSEEEVNPRSTNEKALTASELRKDKQRRSTPKNVNQVGSDLLAGLEWSQVTSAESYTYEGVIDNHFDLDTLTGHFYVTDPEGEEYDGYVVCTLRHDDNGICYYVDGSQYHGAWANNVRSGKGTQIGPEPQTENGVQTFYEGGWKDGLRHGQGKAVLADGSVYVGEFKSDLPNGHGILTEVNGDRSEGEFADGLKNGKFAVFYHDPMDVVERMDRPITYDGDIAADIVSVAVFISRTLFVVCCSVVWCVCAFVNEGSGRCCVLTHSSSLTLPSSYLTPLIPCPPYLLPSLPLLLTFTLSKLSSPPPYCLLTSSSSPLLPSPPHLSWKVLARCGLQTVSGMKGRSGRVSNTVKGCGVPLSRLGGFSSVKVYGCRASELGGSVHARTR